MNIHLRGDYEKKTDKNIENTLIYYNLFRRNDHVR